MRATLFFSLLLSFACTDAAPPTLEELGDQYTMEEEIAATAHLAAGDELEAAVGAEAEVAAQLERLNRPVEAAAPATAIPHVAGLNERLGYDPFDPSQDPCAMALHEAGTPGDAELAARCRALDAETQRCLIPMVRPQTPTCDDALATLSAADRAAFAALL